MAITFTFTEQFSTASKLYEAFGVDASGKEIKFYIACDDATQLQNLAQEAYSLLIAPPTIY